MQSNRNELQSKKQFVVNTEFMTKAASPPESEKKKAKGN